MKPSLAEQDATENWPGGCPIIGNRFLRGGSVVVVSFFVALLLTFLATANAATIPAASVSLTDVRAAVNLASVGDTVTLPAGVASWTSALTFKKSITLQGAGIGQTIIRDGLQSGAPNPQNVVVVNTTVGRSYRLTGIEFQPDPSAHTIKFGQGFVKIDGMSNAVRVDHCRFYNLRNRSLYIGGATFGVVDHCEFVNGTGIQGIIYIDHSGIPGPDRLPGSKGDGSWSTPTNLGSSNAMFFEDNVMTNPNTSNLALTDGNGGTRIVVRRNTITNMSVQGHGTGSTGRTRSIRSAEIYENTMNYTPSLGAQATYIRGGTGVIWGNIVTGASTNSCFTFINFRAVEYIYSLWLGCDGRAAWDLNDMADHTGNEYGGGPSGLYAAGTAGTRSAGRTLVVTGANYPANHWRGYAIINLDQQQPGYSTSMATISGNTSDTISVTTAAHRNNQQAWTAGNRFEIRKVIRPLDMVGNGPGDYLGSGLTPPARWLNQTSEPYYLWNNTNNGNPQGGIGTTPDVNEGVSFINNDTPMPGYTPYAYPHPLVKGLPLPEQMTQKATGNSQHNPPKKRRPWGGKKPDRKKAKKAKENRTNEMAEAQKDHGD